MAGMGRPRTWTSAADMQKSIDSYFNSIEASRREIVNIKTGIPTIFQDAPYWTELCLELGFATRQSAVPYLKGEYDTAENNFSDVLMCARGRIESILAKGSAEKIYDSATIKSVLQNLHDYAEKQEIKAELSQNAALNDQEIEEKLKRLLARHQNSGA
jgi:hypothetical protein